MTTSEKPPVRERREQFIAQLEKLARTLAHDQSNAASQARRTLAQLRRSVSGQRHEHEALALIFEHDPPRAEEKIWLLVAGLFAFNPQPSRNRTPLGASLRQLDRKRSGSTAQKRLRQLLAADVNSLPHHLRSTLQLLAADDIPVNYRALLDDAVVLLRPDVDEERARDVRWRWARDFHSYTAPKTDNDDSSQENDQ
ncbi:type I-E CRISPR-associated protein Cse2/CasB [Saccharopolyspora gloriosae]|uniref:CRISPR system Cascade subunit CasB n=1 Tax=Saccharopolyspora gloriosae TaxID=455344 RepID=A0A840NLU8_9PSEU|nr:type I-E CRISPR-associated protein Cse2/CasB [Saccharopolyspora gloriosae]MBB5070092.1 CRISPR system Cascade subunit CasB [Saccharopolyspora gloriosae]